MNKSKKWTICTIVVLCLLLFSMALQTIIMDPYFHYHAPLEGWEYFLHNSRYQNNGIQKNFEYDAIITGSSMSENFKSSDFNIWFRMKSIKVPLYGGSYKEVNEQIERAIEEKNDIKIIMRSMDYSMLIMDKDYKAYESPEYLYNKNIFDDVNYLLNKRVFLEDTVGMYEKRLLEVPGTTFDEYCNWQQYYTFGESAILEEYDRLEERVKEPVFLTEEEEIMVRQNVKQNIVNVAIENPQIEFYVFITPYSIYWWDDLNQKNELYKHLEAEKIAIEEILVADNINLFSFSDNFEITCDASLYRDVAHYDETVNARMLEWMRHGDYQLTKDNYLEYLKRIEKFYTEYDYESLFETDEGISN